MWQEQEIKQLYEAIFHRKSVRLFAPETLGKEFLDTLAMRCPELSPALTDTPAAFSLLRPLQIKGGMEKKARHFLAVYAKTDEESIINAAFMMQQLELWLSSQGIGACWMGMPQPIAGARRVSGMDFLIMLVFGQPQEVMYREAVDEFPRKPLEEITDTQGFEDILTPLRLAPSAINRQPWFVTAEGNKLRLHMKSGNIITKAMLRNMPLVDMGIGLCHMWLAAQAAGRFSGLLREEEKISSPRGYRYVWTVQLK